MSTYYGYAERDPESHIDWSVIGKDINKKLKAEVKRRDDLKAKIETESLEYAEELKKTPVGADESASNNAIAYTTDASEYKLGLTKALKFGNMNVKKYLQATNSLRIDTEGAFVMYENYQKYNDQKIARMKATNPKDKSNIIEQKLYEHTGGYMNMKNSRPFIDPDTGRVLFAKMDKEGNRLIGKDGEYPPISIPMMNNYITSEIASFDLDGSVAKISKTLGSKTVKVGYFTRESDGLQWKDVQITDATEALLDKSSDTYETDLGYIKTYMEARDAQVDFYMGNDDNVVDYLYNYHGYVTTFDEDEFNNAKADEEGYKKMILLKQDPEIDGYQVVLPDKAKEVAEEGLKKAVDAAQESKYEVSVSSLYKAEKPYRDPKGIRDQQTVDNITENMMDLIIKPLLYNEHKGKGGALDALKGRNPEKVARYYFKKKGDGIEDLMVEVYNPKGKNSHEIHIPDFYNKQPEDIIAKLFFHDYSKILTKDDAGYFSKQRAASVLDPDKPLFYADSEVEDVTSSKRIKGKVLAKDRIITTTEGTDLPASSVWALRKNKNIGNAYEYVAAANFAFNTTPKELEDYQVPLYDKINLVPRTEGDTQAFILNRGIWGSDYASVEFKLPLSISEPFILPMDDEGAFDKITPQIYELLEAAEESGKPVTVAAIKAKVPEKWKSIFQEYQDAYKTKDFYPKFPTHKEWEKANKGKSYTDYKAAKKKYGDTWFKQ